MSEVRLIDANELKEDLKQYFTDGVLDGVSAKLAFNQILHDIDNAPTVEMPQGEWIAEGKEYIQCSHCKEWFKKRYLPYGNYCCKCGAKMKERTKSDKDM